VTANDDYARIQAVQRLKRLASTASAGGLSYAEMCARIGAKGTWTANSLKQFVNRGSVSRPSENAIALAEVLVKYFLNESDVVDQQTSDDLKFVRSTLLDGAGAEIVKFLEAKLNAAQKVATDFYLPERFAYLRYSIDRASVAIIFIELFERANEIYFTMRIHGSRNRRRVVVGHVLSTLSNTHFHGLGFTVSEFIDDQEFENIRFSSANDIHRNVSSNAIGVEEISVSNVLLRDVYFPVCFTGLDGAGTPIAGIGLLLNNNIIEKFGITQNHPGMTVGGELPRGILDLLERAGASTLSLVRSSSGPANLSQ
jgi:hypothetical protein